MPDLPDFAELTVEPEIRKLWPNEATAFTPWLAENIGRLGAVLGMDLEVVKQEAAVGDFSLDILATDVSTHRNVVIENQFGATNHDHLGKLVTYGAGVDASAVVWVTEEVRDEHRQALEWLNRRTDKNLHFFVVVVQVVYIDKSRPAVVFKPIVFPNEWQRMVEEATEGQPSPRAAAYRQFFRALIDELREEHHFTGAREAQPQSWYAFASGFGGVHYGFCFAQNGRVRAELYISMGDADRNKELFDGLYEERESIESAFGGDLEWERLDHRQASRVAAYRQGKIDSSEKDLTEIRRWAVDALLNLKRVFGPHLTKLQGG